MILPSAYARIERQHDEKRLNVIFVPTESLAIRPLTAYAYPCGYATKTGQHIPILLLK
jgi:hypothetical protein